MDGVGRRRGSRPLKERPGILGTRAHRDHHGNCGRISARGENGSRHGSAGFRLEVELLEGGGVLGGRPVGLGRVHGRSGATGSEETRRARNRGARRGEEDDPDVWVHAVGEGRRGAGDAG